MPTLAGVTVRLVQVSERWSGDCQPEDFVELDYENRRKSRQLVVSERGREYAFMLPRGTVLHDGDRLRAEDGAIIGVRAALEALSRIDCSSELDLARVAYHLGNRHVALQLGTKFVAYQRDKVLDHMVGLQGFRVSHVSEAFSPEPGAYRNHQWETPLVAIVAPRIDGTL